MHARRSHAGTVITFLTRDLWLCSNTARAWNSRLTTAFAYRITEVREHANGFTWHGDGNVSGHGKRVTHHHRARLLVYIDQNIPHAQKQDEAGEDPIVMDSNVDDLLALREWVETYPITKETL